MNLYDTFNNRRIEDLIQAADEKLREAERIATAYNIPFRYQLAADLGESALDVYED